MAIQGLKISSTTLFLFLEIKLLSLFLKIGERVLVCFKTKGQYFLIAVSLVNYSVSFVSLSV